jgi:hypothetical protein
MASTNYTIFNGGKDELNFEENGLYSEKKITNKEIGAASTYFTVKVDGTSRGKFAYVQTPILAATQGIGSFEDKTTGQIKYHLDLSLSTKGLDEEQAAQIDHFKENFVEKFDEYNVKKGLENAPSWLGKKMSKEVVEDKYYAMKRQSRDEDGNVIEEYAPTIRFKLWQDKEGKFSTTCYDSEKNEVELNDEILTKGCKVQALCHYQSCWVNKNTGFGPRISLLQLKIWPSDRLQGYAFVDGDEADGGDGGDETEEQNIAEEEDEESVSELDNGVSEEQDAVSEPEPEPEPETEPEPKKKGGRKKKASN